MTASNAQGTIVSTRCVITDSSARDAATKLPYRAAIRHIIVMDMFLPRTLI